MEPCRMKIEGIFFIWPAKCFSHSSSSHEYGNDPAEAGTEKEALQEIFPLGTPPLHLGGRVLFFSITSRQRLPDQEPLRRRRQRVGIDLQKRLPQRFLVDKARGGWVTWPVRSLAAAAGRRRVSRTRPNARFLLSDCSGPLLRSDRRQTRRRRSQAKDGQPQPRPTLSSVEFPTASRRTTRG